jgi:hypothetical protein
MIDSKARIALSVMVMVACLVVTSACACTERVEVQNAPVYEDECQTAPVSTLDSSEITQLPGYLARVWPLPDSTISVQEYNESLDITHFLGGDIGIGVKLLAHRIAEEGDIDVNWMKRSSILVDGVHPTSDDGEFADGAVLYEAYENGNKQGRLLYRTGGPYFMAWRVPLDPGKHEVAFCVESTSGNTAKYGWEFTIVP